MKKVEFSTKRHNILNIVKVGMILFGIGTIIYLLNSYTPLYADDYRYIFGFGDSQGKINSISDIFYSMYWHYFYMNGRIVTHSLAQLFLMLGKPLFNVINSLAFLIFGLLIYYHCFLSFKRIKVLPLIFVYFGLFIATPEFGQSYLWVTGASNYLYGPIITLLFFLPYRLSLLTEKQHSLIIHIILAVLMFLFGIVAGDTNENNGVVTAIAVCAYIIYRIIAHKRIPAWSITGFVGALLGTAFMLFSPGTKKRLGGDGFKLLQIPKRGIMMVSNLFEFFVVLFVILLCLLCLLILFKKRDGYTIKTIIINYPLPIVYFSLFFLSFSALIFSPNAPLRTWSTFLVFLIIDILLVYYHIDEISENYFRKIIQAAFSVLFLGVIIGTAISNIPVLKSINVANLYRDSIICEAVNTEEKEVVVYSISSNNRYSCFLSDGDLALDNDDNNLWKNKNMAHYYGIGKITIDSQKTYN